MEFQFESSGHGKINLNIKGRIDELSVFPKFEGESIATLSINFIETEGINSMGILHWIRWWKDLLNRNPGMTFEVEHARMNIISTASVVTGFLPPNTNIISFYLSYHNQFSGHNYLEFMKKGVNFDDNKMIIYEEITRPFEGKDETFELDCFPSRDLRCFNLELEVI